MTLDPLEYCEFCRALADRQGYIGQCPHPFEGRKLRVFWAVGAWRLLGVIDVVRAGTHVEAAKALRLDSSHAVRIAESPDVIEWAQAFAPLQVSTMPRHKLPSAYDRFSGGPHGRAHYEDMLDQGFDVS